MEGLVFGLPIGWIVFGIALIPLAGAVINGLVAVGCRGGRSPIPKPLVDLVGVGFPILSFALTCLVFSLAKDPATGMTTPPLWDWMKVGDFTVGLSFKVDRLSLLMSLVVTGVGSLIHLYSVGYMAKDAGYARYFSYLNLFLFSMLVLVLAGNLPLLFVGWEGVGLCSYLLIGFWFDDEAKAAAGRKAFIVNRIGDLGFILGMALIFAKTGSLSFDLLEQHRGELFLIATPAALLLFLGAAGKSAQIPLYVWLPDAMAGPTPVSALIHAATMVTAGVYMICRMHFLYTLSPVAMEVVATVGIATAFFAATIAMAQNDIKKILAYSTVSQLGYMIFAVGCGAFTAGLFHLVTHAFFKACLFLCAGSVIHAIGGEQDIWKMGGLRHKMPITFWCCALSVLAISGVAPFAGFFSKDAILWQGFASGHLILWGFGFVTAGMTSFYMARLFALVFLGKPRVPEVYYHAHESPPSMTVPLVALATLSAVGGLIGIPEALGGSDQFFRWLAPLFPYVEFFERLEARGHGMELLLSLVTLLWVFHVGIFTVVVYSQKLAKLTAVIRKIAFLRKLAAAKFYIDEIYDRLLVRPVLGLAQILWRFQDEKVIDGLMVGGSAESVGFLSQTLALIQTGVLQNYALWFAVGAAAVIAAFTLKNP